ncbi:hypothetical protein KAT08_00400 [Candidatus Babeliales bacterium]|nr:hypothetical protein [Candidatus Babeliales bacterium]
MKIGSKKNIFLIFLFFSQVLLSRVTTNKTFFKHSYVGQDLIMQNAMSSYFIHDMKLKKFSYKIKDKDKVVKSGILSRLFSPKSLKKSVDFKEEFANKYDNFFISSSVFYEESSSSSDLAKYFFPNGKTELTVKGYQAADDTGAPDIFAEWLGIPSSGDLNVPGDHNFTSKIKISPYLKRVGTTLYIHKVLHKNFWTSVFAPFVEVSTNIHFKEFDIGGQRPEGLMPDPRNLYFEEPLNATQAFVHPLMKYGRIDNKVHRLSGLADINLRLGYTKKFRDVTTWDIYSGFVIPTGYKPTAEYLFEPIVGNCQHFGVNFGFNLVSHFARDSYFISSFDYQYLFESSEKRSFDLKQNGPWSRYMAATVGLPRTRPERLINFLTQDLNVTPRSLVNFLLALHFKHNKFNLEIGSDIECRSTEKVRLKNGFSENIGIAFYNEGSPDTLIEGGAETYNRSYSAAKIDLPMIINPNIADAGINIINADQLDLSSAKHSNILSFKFYLSTGFDGTINNKPFLLDIGGTYGIGSDNKILDYWNIWTKLNISI